MSDYLIEIENLNVTMNDYSILENINTVFENGNFYSIMGANGSGKTTLLKSIAGMVSINSKAISIDNNLTISFVPDTSNLYEYLTGMEYLVFVGKLNGNSNIEEKATDLLQRFKLFNNRNNIISEYSNGMKQKLSLASAMLTSPDILLLDEPMTGTDFTSNKVIKEFLKEFSKKKMVIMNTHFLDLSYELSDYIYVLKNKTIQETINCKDQDRNQIVQKVKGLIDE
ncbi:ABC transporter ATP-binding protein [Staphylococcus borealis]|uniref:ABC transporter ATP-binding protein n=1 Tax=Staphylococcus borealis TaxID=2742203 RepID=UPI002DBB9933|nr:ABC transporter ATP-binding protein [Staphylococcus borealis]MEB6611072.1 ABC transporter ATP-binding protein [Staphylococcus borealis]